MTPYDALQEARVTVYDARVKPRPGAWAPRAVMWHHTATPNPPKPGRPVSLRVCQQGRPDLPGPLCQWLVDADGGWWWVTDGLANHGGSGDRDVLAWLYASQRPDNPVRPRNNDSSVFNRYTVGVEVEGTGNWTPKVHDSVLRGTRALLAYYGAPKDNLIAHKEATTRKIDPVGIDMAGARRWLRGTPLPAPRRKDNSMPMLFSDKTGSDPEQVFETGSELFVIRDGQDSEALRQRGVEIAAVSPDLFNRLKAEAK